MTEKDDKHSRLVAAFLAGLSKEGIDRQIRHEFRQGYPNASEDEIWLLFYANKKAGWPPSSIVHAKLILSDNIWIFEPAWNSPYGGSRYSRHDLAGRPPYKPFCAFRDDAAPKPAEKIAAADTITKPNRTHHTRLRETMKIVTEILTGEPPDNSPRPRPTDKEFDDVARLAMAIDRTYKAMEAALKIVTEVLADADSLDDAPLAPLAP